MVNKISRNLIADDVFDGYYSSDNVGTPGKNLLAASTQEKAREAIGLSSLQPATAADGGLLINNQKTGTGLERVLTESDLDGVGDLGEMAFLDKATYAQQLDGTSDSVGTTPLGVKRYVEQFGLGAIAPPSTASLQGVRNTVANITSGNFGVDASNVVGSALILSSGLARSQAFWTCGHPTYATRIFYKATNDNWETDSGVVELWTDANFNPDTKANRTKVHYANASRSLNVNDLETIIQSNGGAIFTLPDLGVLGVPIVIHTYTQGATLQPASGMNLRMSMGGSVLTGTRTIAPWSVVTIYQSSSSYWEGFGSGIS